MPTSSTSCWRGNCWRNPPMWPCSRPKMATRTGEDVDWAKLKADNKRQATRAGRVLSKRMWYRFHNDCTGFYQEATGGSKKKVDLDFAPRTLLRMTIF